ncbi:MAG: hypothetical protein LUD25_00525 [Coriobacteriaceae bacterium]|nr:hypothetical protein [Coriobacteriaceae bacterium]
MLYRLHLTDWRIIAHYLGMLVLVGTVAMLVPLVMAFALGETEAAIDFIFSIGISLCAGSLLMLCHVRPANLDWRQAIVVTGFSWIVLAFLGAIPLWLSGHYTGYLDALFDGVSCFTTSGLTVGLDFDHMAISVSTWRILMGLMGGIGVIVIALALGLFGSGAAVASLYQAEGRSDHVMPEVKQSARFILRITVLVLVIATVIIGIVCLVSGQDAVRAFINGFWVSASGFVTIGVSGHSAGIIYYHSWVIEVVVIFCMFLGAINFLLYGDLWRGIIKHLFHDIEIRTLVIWVGGLAILLMFALMAGGFFTDIGSMLRRGLFDLTSAVTNTGFSTLYPGQILYAMGSGALFVFVFGMVVGGSSSSTSGGIKLFRIGIIAKSIVQAVRNALTADHVRPRTFFYHQGRQLLSPELVSTVMVITLLYLAAYVIGSVVGILNGIEPVSAIFEAVSAASNTGLTTGVTSAGMPLAVKIVYMLEMWLGRLEFLTILTVIVQIVLTFVPRRQRAIKKAS